MSMNGWPVIPNETLEKRATTSTSRWRYALGAIAAVLVLAAVMYGVSALSEPAVDEGPRPPDLALPEDESRELYESAMDALESGETTRAVTLLRQSLALDPQNEAARRGLERVLADRASGRDGQDSPPSDPGGGSAPSAGDGDSAPDTPAVVDPDAGFTQPASDLRLMLPARVPGYDLALPVALGGDATVAAEPTTGGPTAIINTALFSVHDRETPAGASAFVQDVTRVAFSQNAADLSVEGIPAYFGTDGTQFASIAFVRGRYVFEIVFTARDVSSRAVRDEAVRAATSFPDSVL